MATRRSSRLAGYGLNGRGYLSDQLGCTVREVDCWLASKDIYIHLNRWYEQCVLNGEPSDIMLGLIKNGNFEKPNNIFEGDILRTALGQQSRTDMRTNVPYINAIHIWAETAKNVVEASRSYTSTFVNLATQHQERFLAITIDLLCLAFHSIAFRGRASVYASMIGHATANTQIEPRLGVYESDTTDTEESAEDDIPTETEDWDRDDDTDYSDATGAVYETTKRDDHYDVAKHKHEDESETEDSELTDLESVLDDDGMDGGGHRSYP